MRRSPLNPMRNADLTPLPEVGTDRFRSFLRDYLDEVRRRDLRVLVTRRGQPIAGIVPVHEARALWNLAHNSELYSEWKLLHRLNEERGLRMAVMQEAEAERRGLGERE